MVRFIFLILFSLNLFAIDIEAIRYNQTIELENIFSNIISSENFEKHHSAKPKDLLKMVLTDPDKKVRKEFKTPKYFKNSVTFWAQIYTQFSSKQVLIHDKNDLSIVYDALDFEPLHNSKKINRYQAAHRRTRITKKAVKDIKKLLRELGHRRRNNSKKAMKLYRHLRSLGVKIPLKNRKSFYYRLAKNIRVQTGQSDKIFQGILNHYPFEKFLNETFDYFNLPRELLAISFVESSFNLKATSRVGASGVWQIMPFISKKLLPTGKYLRPRRNVLLASLTAMHLLAQNYKILKRWDLAVPAYNSGTKHLLRAKRKFKKKKNISLAYILQNYKSRHLGFASKNFYAEFLALVYVLSYKDLMFPIEGIDFNSPSHNPKLRYKDINVYVSKCGLIPKRLYAALKNSSPYLSEINNHLRYSKGTYPRGTLIFSDIHLTSKRYYKLSQKELRRNFPINYKKRIRKHKCVK